MVDTLRSLTTCDLCEFVFIFRLLGWYFQRGCVDFENAKATALCDLCRGYIRARFMVRVVRARAVVHPRACVRKRGCRKIVFCWKWGGTMHNLQFVRPIALSPEGGRDTHAWCAAPSRSREGATSLLAWQTPLPTLSPQGERAMFASRCNSHMRP